MRRTARQSIDRGGRRPREQRPTTIRGQVGRWPGIAGWAAPLAAFALCVPCLKLPYEWDDFDFLARAQNLTVATFLPDPRIIFYRPLSRELYFGLVWTLGPDGAFWAHVLNAILLALSVALLGSIGARLGGPKAGFLAGAFFAGLGVLPVLVGFVSCIQDLLAIVCILACLRSHLNGKPALGVLWMCAALLSKETSVALVPAMLASEWALGRTWQRVGRIGIWYAALIAAWVAIHPGLHALAARKFGSIGTAGYVGLDNPSRFESLGKGALALTNLPLIGPVASWTSVYTLPLIGAGALLVAALFALVRREPRTRPAETIPQRRVWILLGLMALLPLAFTSVIVRNWLPYYSCIPGLGTSLMLGMALSRVPTGIGAAAVAAFLVQGVLFRQMSLDPSVLTERNLRSTAVALNLVEAQFRELHPEMPKGAHVLVSVGASGSAGVYFHIHRSQALRIWYADRNLVTLKPANRVPTTNPELLFRITPDLTLVEIDADGGRFRSTGVKPALSEIRTAARSYAKALAGSGETIRAASILLSMPLRSEEDRQSDARLAVALLLAGGREREARLVLAGLPPLPRAEALRLAAWTILEPLQGVDSEGFVLRAFEIPPTDLAALRDLMRFTARHGYTAPALRLANRVQALSPGDPESASLIHSLATKQARDLVTVPPRDEQ